MGATKTIHKELLPERKNAIFQTMRWCMGLLALGLAMTVGAQDFEATTKKATEEWDADAQYKLGLMYAEGRGVGQNDAKAAQWFGAAAWQGNVKAQYRIGQMYAKGQGVARNDLEAMRWFRKAARQGDKDAKAALDVLEKTNATHVHDVDYLKEGMKASVVRRLVLKDKWIPNSPEQADKSYMLFGTDRKFYKKGFTEIEGCAMDRPVCLFKYKKKQACLEVMFAGEEDQPDTMRVTGWTHDCQPSN
jgi:TPR repeat protein